MEYSQAEMDRFHFLYEQCFFLFKQEREKTVNRASPYSKKINCYIRSIREVGVYVTNQLSEGYLTRPALLISIDPQYCDSNGVDNLTKMRDGKPPIDATTGSVIDLHHIGQHFESPFAELPHDIHNSKLYYSVLHQCDVESWRSNSEYIRLTNTEIKKYWMLRSEMFL